MATSSTSTGPSRYIPLVAVVVCGAILLMLCADALFVQRIPIDWTAAWRTDNIIAFCAKATLVAPILFALFTLIVTKWFDVLGLIETRRQATAANTTAQATAVAVAANSQAIDDHAARLNGQLDASVAAGASAAAAAAIEHYAKTGDIHGAYDAAAAAARAATQALNASGPAPGALTALPPAQATVIREVLNGDSTTPAPGPPAAPGSGGGVAGHTL